MAARSGMNALIENLRDLSEASVGDWTRGTAIFWDDDHLQAVLDQHRTEWFWEPVQPAGEEYTTGGTVEYKRYPLPAANWEATTGGTAVFYLQDATWAAVGTALYAVDYRRGLVTFNVTTGGSAYYLTGYSYNLNAAAADVWRAKARHFATAYDVSTDNHNLKRSQLYDHCMQMAARFEQADGPRGVYAERGDC